MHWIWRAVIAALLVIGPALWLPAASTDAASPFDEAATVVQGPAADNINNDDPEELCLSENPRKRKKCRYNGWDNDNWITNENDNSEESSPPIAPGTPVTVDGLTVELWKSMDSPVVNMPLLVTVKGAGAPIERVWWWAEGPTYTGINNDDLAFVGTMSYECGSYVVCAWSWPAVPRYTGWYTLHARVRDTSGREVQTDWQFEVVATP